MRVVRSLLLIVACGACGDNGAGPGETLEPCEPPASAMQLPATGMYIDPHAIAIDAACVENGLRDLPGRWFVVDPSQMFRFEYPKYLGSCSTGFRRVFQEDDHDASDGYTFYTWSDGTRYFERAEYAFGEEVFVFVYAACMTAGDRIAATEVAYDTERGERVFHETGTRFAPKDGLSRGLTLVGELGMIGDRPINALNLVVDGTRAYVAGYAGLDIIDVSDPAAPMPIGHYENGAFNDVRVVSDGTNIVAFLSPSGGGEQRRTEVVNVTNPASPSLVQFLAEWSHSLFVQERNGKRELYLATYNESVPKYDVTAPLTPVGQGFAIVPGEVSGVHDLFVAGDRIYANNTEQGLVVFDVSAGLANEVELGRFRRGFSHASWAGTINGRQLVLAGDEGMTRTEHLGAHLSILDGDSASPTFMQEISRYQTRREVGIHNFEVHGNLVYIAYYQDGVRIVDLSDATRPREVAHYNTWVEANSFGGGFEGALGIRKVGDYIYVADILRGLMIFREE